MHLINGVVIGNEAIESEEAQRLPQARDPSDAARRSLAVRELLLQRARKLGLAGAGSTADREQEDGLITQVLDAEVATPTPTESECRRHYDTHREKFSSGELVEARHIFIAVMPGAPVALLRVQAETLLAELRADPTQFAERARQASNCPSGQHGGNLG